MDHAYIRRKLAIRSLFDGIVPQRSSVADHGARMGGPRFPTPGVRLSSAASFRGNDSDDPALKIVRLVFPDRMDQPRDKHSFYRQLNFYTSILGIAAAPHHCRISSVDRVDRLHTSPIIALRNITRDNEH